MLPSGGRTLEGTLGNGVTILLALELEEPSQLMDYPLVSNT